MVERQENVGEHINYVELMIIYYLHFTPQNHEKSYKIPPKTIPNWFWGVFCNYGANFGGYFVIYPYFILRAHRKLTILTRT